MTVKLRNAVQSDLHPLYEQMYGDLEWTKFDGPYFGFETKTLDEYKEGYFKSLLTAEQTRVIEFDGDPVGVVSYYWEDENTRWLESGIAIYSPANWGKGIGRAALIPWITHLFNTLEIERVGMTTWSGNPRMIACAEAIGMQIEGQIRRVRYYNELYYDSVKLGVLREEWFGRHS